MGIELKKTAVAFDQLFTVNSPPLSCRPGIYAWSESSKRLPYLQHSSRVVLMLLVLWSL